jgi:polyisoprenoid-binding protein YceI
MKMKHVVLVTAILYVASQIAFAQKRIEKSTNGKITFKINNAGVEVSGTLDIAALEISIDEKDLEQSLVVATADPNTINTGIKIRDNHLRRTDYFDVADYPTIKLQSKKFARAGKSLEGVFDLTIKNVTKTVIVRFTHKKQNNSDMFDGSFSINRMDFKIGEESPILDNEVRIYFSVVQ